MNLVHCDQHPTLVYDFGTSSIKFGYGGHSLPYFRIPSASAQQVVDNDDPQIQFGEEWLERNQRQIEVVPMIDNDGSFIDSEMFNSFMDWTFSACFGEIDPSNWGVLFSQPASMLSEPDKLNARRMLIAEQSFEFARHPAISFHHDASLACYSFAKHTGMVIDFGWSHIRIVPVLEGHPIRRFMRYSTLGGFGLTNMLGDLLTENGKFIKTRRDLTPSDGFGGCIRPEMGSEFYEPTESQRNFCRRNVLIDMIRTTLHFAPPEDLDKEKISKYVYYMAKDEPVVGGIQSEITHLSKSLFDPSDENSLQNNIAMSISACPADIQDQLWSSILPTGGLSRLPGFSDMLHKTLTEIAPDKNPKIIAPPCVETSGENAVWVGGSIVASYEYFPKMAITMQEWEEFGPSILERKCL